MDDINKRIFEMELEKRKEEDELFSTMMANRLQRQMFMSNMVRNRDSSVVSEVSESEEEIYTVKLDEDGEFDVEKID